MTDRILCVSSIVGGSNTDDLGLFRRFYQMQKLDYLEEIR